MKNFEKYQTAAGRDNAFYSFCHGRTCSECELSAIGRSQHQSCQFFWLDLEVAVERPLPCPFCGREVFVGLAADADGNRRVQLKCTGDYSCGYCGPMRLSDKDAIATHNWVARAVMDAKKKGEGK